MRDMKTAVFVVVLLCVIAMGFVGAPLLNPTSPPRAFWTAFGGAAFAILATCLLADRFGYFRSEKKKDDKPKDTEDDPDITAARDQLLKLRNRRELPERHYADTIRR